ncbi:hypothetical protein KM043_013838 [Ampulex compressa]|nr:hypothetical protein KM043_013838 [Ampulex compressa]
MNVFEENPLLFFVDNARPIYTMDAFEDVRRIVELADMGCDARSRLSGFPRNRNRRCHERVRAASRNWQDEEELRENINFYGSSNAADVRTYFRLREDPNRSYLASSPNKNNYRKGQAINLHDNYIGDEEVPMACKSNASLDERKSGFRRARRYARRNDYSETGESFDPRLDGRNREKVGNTRINSASMHLSEGSREAGHRSAQFYRKNSRSDSSSNCAANVNGERLCSYEELNFAGYPSNGGAQKPRKCWNRRHREATSSYVNETSSYAKNKKPEGSYDSGIRSRPASASSRSSKDSRFTKLFAKEPRYVETKSSTIKDDDPLNISEPVDRTLFSPKENLYEVTEELVYPPSEYPNLVDRAVDKDSLSDYSQFSRNANRSESDIASITSGISIKISDLGSSEIIVKTEVDPAFWQFIPLGRETLNETTSSPRTNFDLEKTKRVRTSTKNGLTKSGKVDKEITLNTKDSTGNSKATSSSVTIVEHRSAVEDPQNLEDSRVKNVRKSEDGGTGISRHIGSVPNESRSKTGVSVIGKTAACLKRRFVLGKSRTESGVASSDDPSVAKEIRARPESLAPSRLPIRIAGRNISRNPLAAYRRADANSDASKRKEDKPARLVEDQQTCEKSVRSRTKPKVGKSVTENSWKRQKLIASN